MSNTLSQNLRKTKGFSLIELLIVTVISMTLLSLVVYKIQNNVLTFTADAVVSQLISSSFDARYHALLVSTIT